MFAEDQGWEKWVARVGKNIITNLKVKVSNISPFFLDCAR